MSVKPEDFLDLSNNLLQLNNADEISIRCSIKNSYYSAYHKVRSILTDPVPNYANMGTHEKLTYYLAEEAHRYERTIDRKSLRRLSIYLRQMKAERHIADYELDVDLPIQRAQHQLGQANTVMNLCTSISSDKAA